LGFPFSQARAFEGQFAFVETDRHFDIPAASIGQDDSPGIFGGAHGVIGEQMPEFATRAWVCDDQPKWLWVVFVKNGRGKDTAFALTTSPSIS
jgi:hypothetical protein